MPFIVLYSYALLSGLVICVPEKYRVIIPLKVNKKGLINGIPWFFFVGSQTDKRYKLILPLKRKQHGHICRILL